MRSTVAGTSNLVRLKSTILYSLLAPPPRLRDVIRPVLFRPPDLVSPSVRDLTGRPFQSSERSISTSPRWPGVVGLYDFSAMLCVFRLLMRQSNALPMVKPPEGGQFKASQKES